MTNYYMRHLLLLIAVFLLLDTTQAQNNIFTLDSIINSDCQGNNTGAIYLSDSTPDLVVINEVMYMPLLSNGIDSNTGEWIELLGTPGMDISCYVLTDGDWTITIPTGTEIPADGIFSIGNDIVWGVGTFDLDVEQCACFTEGTGGQSLLILTDDGEHVSLYDASGTFVEGVIYASPSAFNSPGAVSILSELPTVSLT